MEHWPPPVHHPPGAVLLRMVPIPEPVGDTVATVAILISRFRPPPGSAAGAGAPGVPGPAAASADGGTVEV